VNLFKVRTARITLWFTELQEGPGRGVWVVSAVVEIKTMAVDHDREETAAASDVPPFFVETEDTSDVPQFYIEPEGALDIPKIVNGDGGIKI